MANDLTGRQWTVDTPGATTLWQGNAKINTIVFTDYSADADNFVVTDINDRVVFSGNGASDLQPVSVHEVGWVQGVKVPTLTDGKLLFMLA